MISKDYIKANPGEYPVYSSQTMNNGVMGRISTYDYEGEYVTWTANGYAGAVFYHNGKFNATTDCGLIKIHDPKILNKYLYFILGTLTINYIDPKNPYRKLISTTISKIPIPIPSLATQNRIITILDKFEKICNSFTEGLPAEIEARKKQILYYKNLLLQFD